MYRYSVYVRAPKPTTLRHFCDDLVCPDPVWKLSICRVVFACGTARLVFAQKLYNTPDIIN